MKLFAAPLFFFLLFTLVKCTLSSVGAPGLRVVLAPPFNTSPLAKRDSTRLGGRPLESMSCFGVVIAGKAPPVAASQIFSRSPTCMKLSGAFHGPYSLAQAKSGLSLTLLPGTYTISIVGFYGAADCAGGLASLFNSGASTSLYEIGASPSFTFPDQGTVSVTSAYSQGITLDRTPLCPPQISFTCNGFTACDNFIGPDESTIISRYLQTGQQWIVSNANAPVIRDDSANTASQNSEGIDFSFFQVPFNESDVEVSAELQIGDASLFNIGQVTARVGDMDNYVWADVYKQIDGTPACTLRIGQTTAGSRSMLSSTPLNYSADCSATEFGELNFVVNGSHGTATFRGTQVYATIVGAGGGNNVGFGALASGPTVPQRLRNFRARLNAR